MFWFEIGSGFEEPGGTPQPRITIVPHSGGQEQGVNHVIIILIIAYNIMMDDSFRLSD